ncbi:sensor histidine kinase [Streptomyces litchfieldiae]|uniref:histidine kinase n=1 Tax=Streptomyces litchfieldiae TaxID=3075543 RepID=A0ABU2MV97_9ACTN|nr:ATP-binding protein [Streptomyces sp. DSM 44938]MDT0345327.1 ATP-binding protein [Streptomyces sp. DSM 44938]
MRPPLRPTRTRRWIRLPDPTVRLRLTLLYGALFFVFGAVLLLVTIVIARGFPRAYVNEGPGEGNLVRLCAGLDGPAPDTEAIHRCDQAARALVDHQRAQTLDRLLAGSGLMLITMTAAALCLGWLVAGRVLRPLRTINAAARRISAHSLHERLALPGPKDELTQLGDTFNALLARLEASFAAQRQFVANASHELRTPLARQRTLIEVALADPQPTVTSLRHACRRVLVTGEQQERLIEALLTLARSERGLDRRTPIDLQALADDAVTARRNEAEHQGIRLRADLAPATALGDARLLERLAANLLDNAVRHNTACGMVEVMTGTSAGQAVLRVRNSGPLIPPEDLARLFQPFQRLNRERTTGHTGLGLGLPIVTAIAHTHDAVLNAHPMAAGGLTVEIRFPDPAQPLDTPDTA